MSKLEFLYKQNLMENMQSSFRIIVAYAIHLKHIYIFLCSGRSGGVVVFTSCHQSWFSQLNRHSEPAQLDRRRVLFGCQQHTVRLRMIAENRCLWLQDTNVTLIREGHTCLSNPHIHKKWRARPTQSAIMTTRKDDYRGILTLQYLCSGVLKLVSHSLTL